ncbi:MAG: glutathione peroxidase [Bacteriovoracaceae bacterium]|nr:glutathione peroxidase [Bacteriovoracaceae bacterium]
MNFKKIILSIVIAITYTFAGEIYDLEVTKTDGDKLKLSELKGKTVLFVNVATKCGYTGQLDDLEKLYQKYKAKNFMIVGIPSNDFGGQTPEGNKEVAKFCRLKYGVTFPLTMKTPVLGDKKPQLIKLLVKDGGEISWNFEKFLVSKVGKVVGRFKSGIEPLSTDLKNKIESIL